MSQVCGLSLSHKSGLTQVFLCVLMRHLPELTLAIAFGRMHRELVTGCDCMWVRHMGRWGCSWDN